MIQFRSAIAFLLGVLSFPLHAQSEASDLNLDSLYAEVGGLYSTTTRTPFWLQTNRYGTVPRSGSALTLRAGGHRTWVLGNPNALKNWRKRLASPSKQAPWRVAIGAEVVVNAGQRQSVLLPQAYGAVRYRAFELFAGRRRLNFGLADSTLGTGSYVWSGNALPIPRIQFGIPRFTEVPFTGGWMYIMGTYADGWFENTRPVTSELKLHQKQLYGRLGKPGGTFRLYAGFNHQVQWGGRSPYETIDGQMPKGFKNYLSVVTGGYGKGVVTNFDSTNRAGNHLGTIDFAIEIDGNRTNWFLYRQNVYEDGSLYYLTSIADGLNGLRVRRKNAADRGFKLKEIVLEGLYTKSQGGPEFIIDVNKKRGKDNYFNNVQVRDGWSYYDRIIGTPFITPTSETIWKYPPFADFVTSNNRVWVVHAGLRGTLAHRVEWTTKLSYSSNEGTYDLPFPETAYQFSGLLAVEARTDWLGGMTVKASVAADAGDLYPRTYGGMLSLRKEWGGR